jgi:hypothetical protein
MSSTADYEKFRDSVRKEFLSRKQVLIAGASGLVGYAAMRYFGRHRYRADQRGQVYD